MSRRDETTTREQILDIALELFAAKGYAATTTREITDRLDITPAALYYHFPSKDACLVALVEPYLERVEALVAAQSGEITTEKEARAFLRAYRDVLDRNVQLARVIDRDPAVRTHPALGPRTSRLTSSLRTLLAGSDPGNGDLVRASAALGALRRPILRSATGSSQSPDPLIDAAISALGLAARRRRSGSGG